MGEVKNGARGDLAIAGLDNLRVGIQTPTDSEAAGGAKYIVAFPPPKGARKIAVGDMVALDGEPLRVLAYGPSRITPVLMLMQLGAVAVPA